jgi:hypothetical protein
MIYIYEVITTQMNLRDKSDWKVMSCSIERMRINKKPSRLQSNKGVLKNGIQEKGNDRIGLDNNLLQDIMDANTQQDSGLEHLANHLPQ